MSKDFSSPASATFSKKLPDTSFSAVKRKNIFSSAIGKLSKKAHGPATGPGQLLPGWKW